MIYAIACIAILSFIVWVHHMFTTGVMAWVKIFFMITTIVVAVPTGIKIFNWVGTLWKGAISFEPPMLFALSFIVLFTIGGFTGLMLGVVVADYQYQDTYFVVAHFHHTIVSGVYFAILTGVYYWLPKWSGRYYSFKLANWHFWLSTISVNLTFFPMYFLGLTGMPRRIPDYNIQFTDLNMLATVGAMIFGISQLIFLWIIIENVFLKRGKPATAAVWEATKGLEWTVPSPAPHHTFMTEPSPIKE
jgi:cytochrome c oxidase subunit 1